jgi:hypothetical protein
MQEATLELNGRVLRPTSVTGAILQEYPFGSRVLLVNSNELVSIRSDSGVVQWRNKSALGFEFSWLFAEGSTAYLLEAPADRRETRVDRPTRLRRIDVDSGKWLQDIPFPVDSDIVAAASYSNRLVVLSIITAGGKHLVKYRVAGFQLPEGQEVWNQTFSAVTEYGPAGVALWATRRPNQAVSALRNLTWMGADVLICAGSRQDLICLASEDGNIRWKVGRIWEIGRGFIGPSVWSHSLGRFGESRPSETTKEDAARSKIFDQQWRSEIIGGPIVVKRRESEWSASRHSIFIAVARGPAEAEPFASYIADCIVYELDDRGKPLSLVTLPRTTHGSSAYPVSDSVVWLCQNNAMVRLEATYDIPTMGPGGPDLSTRVAWYRQFSEPEATAWLISDKAGDPVAFGVKGAIRPLSGGYVKKSDDPEYHFPLAMIDYADGSTASMSLRVPLTAAVPEPRTNIEDKGAAIHTSGPYLLAITRLHLSGHTLAITLGMEKWSGVVRFNIQ